MATQANITVDQGSDFATDITLTDISGSVLDLNNHTVAGKIKKSYTSQTSVSFDAVISDGDNGLITLSLTHTVTGAMKAGRYVYDIEVTHISTGDITRVLEVEITPGVT